MPLPRAAMLPSRCPAAMSRNYCVGGGVVAAVRGTASCSALSGSTKPEPKFSSRSPGAEPLALRSGCGGCRRRQFRIASSSSATMPLTSAAATEVPVVN